MTSAIIEKWQARKAVIAIIGLGYVGLPLALNFAKCGITTIGIDSDKGKLDSLQRQKSYLQHIGDDKIAAAFASGFEATDDIAEIASADGIIICLPTPLKDKAPDLSYIRSSMQALLPHLKKHQIISLESTTYPNTTAEEIVAPIMQAGFKVGEDFFVIYSPEREDPGNSEFSTADIPKVIGGYSENCLSVGMAMYRCAIKEMVAVSNMQTAEMAKLLENIYRAVNIGLVNEMKKISEAMDIDIYEVINAAKSKPFGFKAFYPSPGVGGHCIPVDPFYLTWKAGELGLDTKMINLAGEINQSMPAYVVGILKDSLQKPLKVSRILLLGVSYKKNIGDMRESPSLEIMQLLQSQGAIFTYSDPFVDAVPSFNLQHQPLDKASIKAADAVIIISDHDDFDYELLEKHANLIIDCRGRYAPCGKKIIRA